MLTELHGWGRRPRSSALVAPPPSSDAPLADPTDRGVLARGLGRSYGDAALNAGGTVHDMTTWRALLAFDPATGLVSVAAGMSLHALISAVLPFGWFVPVTPGTRQVTVGGAIAADIHGKNHHVDGGFCDNLQSFELQTPAGEPITATAQATPEVFWATAGGMGLTGVITQATIQLIPVETSMIRVDTERASDLDDLMARMEAHDDAYRYSVAWIDLLARGAAMGRSVLTRGDHAELDELGDDASLDPFAFSGRTRFGVPDLVPDGILQRRTVQVFNELWFRKAPKLRTGALESVGAFFHPLDGLRDWNRLYGKRGFLQYQFVIPAGAEDTLRTIVGLLSQARCPSFLAVLKRFRAQQGYLSFPLAGWTLALDIPIGMSGLAELLDRTDELVADVGGRVYLAKDSRLSPPMFRRMYPRFDEWREIRDRLDPGRVMNSDLARRLQLLDPGPTDFKGST